MERRILTPEELTTAVQDLKGWNVGGKTLKKSVKFENFALALDYVNHVGTLAEAVDHHPDITFGWGYAELSLTTHDRGGITDVDIALAKQIDSVSG